MVPKPSILSYPEQRCFTVLHDTRVNQQNNDHEQLKMHSCYEKMWDFPSKHMYVEKTKSPFVRLKTLYHLYRRVPISVEKKKPPASKPYEVKAAMIRGKNTFFFAADLCVFEFFFSPAFFFFVGVR